MNKRQHKKVTCNLVAKIVAKVKYPELNLHSNKVERKLFKKDFAKIKWLVKDTLQRA